jgi:hypothetical protein
MKNQRNGRFQRPEVNRINCTLIDTLNREATDENLYDDLTDSSGKEVKSPERSGHLEDDKRLQCSATM